MPAIRYDTQRQRRRFFSIWKERLPERIDENNAIEHDRLRLLRELDISSSLQFHFLPCKKIWFDISDIFVLLRSGATLIVWQEGARAKAARRAANRFRAFAARSPLPPSSSSVYLVPPTPTSHGRLPYPASAPRLRILEPSSRTASPSTSNPARLEANAVYTPVRRRESTIATSSSMPLIYSASRLRKEVGSSPSRRNIADSSGTVPTSARIGSTTVGQAPFNSGTTARSRRGSTLHPESIALPPSSSATGPSSSSSANSSPIAQQSSLPTTSLAVNKVAIDQQANDEKVKKHDRKKNRSRDAFEEGVLKEMRERLAAAGLGDGGGKSKN